LNRTKQYKKAILVLQETVRLFPNDAVAYNNLGSAYFCAHRYGQAFLALRRALDLDPDFVEARYNLALAYLGTKDRSAAMEQYVILKRTSEESAQMLYEIMFRNQILSVKPE